MDITTISGIVSCYIFSHSGKMYYLFGDKHYTRRGNCKELGYQCDYFNNTFTKTYTYGTQCTNIGPLLHNWFTYNNDHSIATDFYIELSYTKENERVTHKYYNDIIENRKTPFYYEEIAPFQDKSWLQLTHYIMKPCFIREKTQCPYYPNVHVHYTDVRILEQEGEIFVNPFDITDFHHMEYVKLLILHYKIILGYLLDIDGYNRFLDKIHLIPEEIKDDLVHNISLFTVTREINGNNITMYKTAWELHRLEQSYPMIAEKLRVYIQTEAEQIIQKVYNTLKTQKMNYDLYNDLLLDMQSLSMDVYTLSRVFIQNQSDEIIIYAGAYHIQFYVPFLQQCGFDLLTSVPYKKGQNCITMDNLPLYLDGNKYRQYNSS